MPTYPSLNPQVIGQAESALGAILDPLLARTDTTFNQWLVLTVTAASGAAIDRGQLLTRITGARKIDDSAVFTAIAELTAAELVRALPGEGSRIGLTEAGQARYSSIRTALGEVTSRLFGDLPAEDLATAGRVLAIITERANAELPR
jgi:DNA-binding MarR family transcriptional regulator